nr:FAD-dependent oxidoreductase [Methanolinea mesophila]
MGGGLTGVTLSRLLTETGDEVTVLEAASRIGGLCRSRTEQGFTFDAGGSHIIFSRDCEVLSFMVDALRGNRNERIRNTKIFYKGRYVKYPFENGLAGLPKDDLFFCINEFIKTLIAEEKGELAPPENFRDWIYFTFGKGIAECYMVPYNEKIWNFPVGKMSHHWVEGRVPRPPVEDVIKSAIGIETEGYTHQAVFTYPVTGGIEAVIRAIAEPVRETIRTNFPVRSVKREDDEWVIGDGDSEIRAERLISTIPLQNLIPALNDVPLTVAEAVKNLKYNSVACIFIGIRGEVPPYSWVYLPDPETGLMNRISFPSNYSPGVAPEGHGSILAEITYNEGDAVSLMSDQDLISHVTLSLEKMGVIDRTRVVYSGVERQEFAYVVYDLDYQKNIRIIRDYFDRVGIDLVGRFSQFEYLNMDGCIRSAMNYAGNLACR